MPKDAHGLEIPPRTRWREQYEKLLNEFLCVKRDKEIALQKLEQAQDGIRLMKTQIQILRNQNKALRAGQVPLPLEEVA